jgi:hypothetical protein
VTGLSAQHKIRVSDEQTIRRKTLTRVQYFEHRRSYRTIFFRLLVWAMGQETCTKGYEFRATRKKRLDYRDEALSIRAVAREAKDETVREQLLLIASLYDRLACISEQTDRPIPQLAADRSTGSSDVPG